MDPGAHDFQEQIQALQARLQRLETVLQQHGLLDDLRVRADPPVPVQPRVEPTRPAPQPPLFTLATGRAAEDSSLETRIGTHWFNRIGIVAVLIGVAWFLKLAMDNNWIGNAGRVLVGLAGGAAIIAWSELFRRKQYTAFSYTLKAVGSGILYLSLWAAFALYHLIPTPVAFAAMIVVTGFNGFLSWIEDAELLALYAIVGGLSTPLLISTGENHEVSLFSYLLMLDLAVLLLSALRPWLRLLLAAFGGTLAFFGSWASAFYSPAQSLPTAIFLGAFFVLFALSPYFVRLKTAEGENPTSWEQLVLLLMPLVNAAGGFLGFLMIYALPTPGWTGAWIAIGFAAFYLFLLRLPERIFHARPKALSALHLAAVVTFLMIAIPMKAEGRWLTVGWMTEGAALLWCAARLQSQMMRAFGVISLLLGLFVLSFARAPVSVTPILNARFATYCVAIAAVTFTAILAANISQPRDNDGPLSWQWIAAGAGLMINFLILFAVGWEIHSYWWFLRWTSNGRQLREYHMYAQFTYSAFFMAFGALLLAVGFWRKSPFLRWQALVLIAVAIGKVFLSDIVRLSQGYRILSFIGLGALLLAVSFIYQRDLLHLREGNEA